jgi:rSAM/selenodomain-associated transferase 1
MVDVADAAVVAILTRAPAHGGKSRLFAELRVPPDPALLTALLLDTVDGTNVPGVNRVVAVEPAEACDDVLALVPHAVSVVPQRGDTLGDRMRTLMNDLFEGGARSIVLVGSDLPDIAPDVVGRAFALLDDDRDAIVLGPATDGGYYLIGAAGRVPPVFEGIDWGTSNVLAATVRRARDCHVRVRFVEGLTDVDTVADLSGVRASRTKSWVRAHLRQE